MTTIQQPNALIGKIVRDSVAPARISGCYGEGGDDEREDESCADVVEVIVVEVD